MSIDIPYVVQKRMIKIIPGIYWDHSVAATVGINGDVRCSCGYATHMWGMAEHQTEEIERIRNLELSLPDDLQETTDDDS